MKAALLMFLLLVCCLQAEPIAILSLDHIPAEGQTEVWSPLFQATWDQLNSLHKGKMEKVVPENLLITRLNNFKWDEKATMPKNAYKIFIGPSTNEFNQATAEELKNDYEIIMPPNPLPDDSAGLAAYGVLFRNLQFQKKFFRSEKRPLEFKDGLGKNNKVSFFGSAGSYSESYGKNVQVLSYKDHGKSFILSVAIDQKDEHLIVYRPSERVSFEKAIEDIDTAKTFPLDGPYGTLKNGILHRRDTVKIPYLSLDVSTQFTDQLGGALHYAGEETPWTVARAYQITQFELFESGARVRVHTGADVRPFGDPPPPPKTIPRQFICDEPFFVFIWRESAKLPYFGTWIGSSEPMTPFKMKK